MNRIPLLPRIQRTCPSDFNGTGLRVPRQTVGSNVLEHAFPALITCSKQHTQPVSFITHFDGVELANLQRLRRGKIAVVHGCVAKDRAASDTTRLIAAYSAARPIL